MTRALRIALWAALAGALILCGVEVGVFMRMNDGWVTLRWPLPQATAGLVTHVDYESPVWVLALGWVIAATLIAAVVLWFPVYLTRRRHLTAEIKRLTRENADLRNLPITAPAPLEDLPAEAPAGTALVRRADAAAAPPAPRPDALDPVVASED
ncbi:MAG TPA: hypothetical protein VGQ83_28325 [Polyangia bacterium]|jgi:hypothetical protein